MRKSRFTETQIVVVLKQAEAVVRRILITPGLARIDPAQQPGVGDELRAFRRVSRRATLLRVSSSLLLTIALSSSQLLADSGDWLGFRGSRRNGISPEAGLARSWDESGPIEVWRRPIGEAFSGVAVSDGFLYTTESDSDGEYVLKINAVDGRSVWRRRVSPQFRESFGNGPRATPAVDEHLLYALSGTGIVAALRRSNGDIAWSRDLAADFDLEVPQRGFASAPLLVEDLLILNVGATGDRAVVAFDKATGELRWTGGEGQAAYGSPILIEVAGERQLVVVDTPGVLGLSLAGEQLWRHEWAPDADIKPALPVFVAPDLLIVSASYGVGAIALRLSPGQEGSGRVTEVWRNREMRNHFNSSLFYGHAIYGFDNSTFKAISPETGETLWAIRGGLGKGSVIAADGLLIVLTETGTLKIFDARSDEYPELLSKKALHGRSWTEPTLVGGHLYLRNREEILALDLRSGGHEKPSLATSSISQETPDLEVDEILRRHLEARGGRDRLERLRAIRIRGSTENNGAVLPFTIVRQAPDHFRIETKAHDTPMVTFSDGESVFTTDFTSRQILQLAEDATALVLEDQGDFLGPLVDPERKGHRVDFIGHAALNGAATFHLRVVLKSGRTQDYYIDAYSFLLVRRTLTAGRPQVREYVREYLFQGYREHRGVMVPSLIERNDGPFTTTFLVDSVELDPQVDEKLFEVPSD